MRALAAANELLCTFLPGKRSIARERLLTGGAFAVNIVLPFSGRELLTKDLTSFADTVTFRRIDDVEGLRIRRIAHVNILSGHCETICGYIRELEAVPVPCIGICTASARLSDIKIVVNGKKERHIAL